MMLGALSSAHALTSRPLSIARVYALKELNSSHICISFCADIQLFVPPIHSPRFLADLPVGLLQVMGRDKEEVLRRIKNSGLRAQGKMGDVEDNYEVVFHQFVVR